MEFFSILMAFLVIGAFLFVFLKNFFGIFFDLYKYFRFLIKKHLLPIKPEYRAILKKYFSYYILLNEEDKKDFEQRLKSFMYSKDFIPRGGIVEVTDEMMVLISASAIQLTFGLPMLYLENFKRILIYPDTYYSNINKQYHHGEVNPRAGLIVLSWKRFVDGYVNGSDSLNVGLHEMAHAIHFEDRIANGEYGFLDQDAFQKFHEIYFRETRVFQEKGDHYLRAYAFTNEYEFFAVAIEHFFEDPKGMKEHHPDLYVCLKRLINQDPARFYGHI